MQTLIAWLSQPWPWYVSGPIIGLTVPLLLITGNKMLGISSSLRHTCAAVYPGKIPFLNYNWKAESWNLLFVAGIFFGGLIGGQLLVNPEPVALSPEASESIAALGISANDGLLPEQLFGTVALSNPAIWFILVLGGFLIGFGARYAGGCTSGHAIMGLSSLQWPSLVTVIFFFVGGLIMTFFLSPWLYALI
ncbi:MAG: YeeE/YedE family protein [Bacteroidia bacterium]